MGKVKGAIKDASDTLGTPDPFSKEGVADALTGGHITAGGHIDRTIRDPFGSTRDVADKLGLRKDDKEPEATASEKAAAEVAAKEYDFARQLDFVKDEYEKRIERLGSDEMQAAVSGRANVDAQRQVSGLAQAAENSLQQQGVDPSSGRAASTMTNVTSASGEAIGGAQSESEFALDSAHLEGKGNRIAMAVGEKTKAVAGLQDIAEGANKLADQKARNKFNSNAATSAAIGTAAGVAASAYKNSDN